MYRLELRTVFVCSICSLHVKIKVRVLSDLVYTANLISAMVAEAGQYEKTDVSVS